MKILSQKAMINLRNKKTYEKKNNAFNLCFLAVLFVYCLLSTVYCSAQNINGSSGTFTGTVGIGTTTVVAGGKLEASGIIYSNTGGFKFPDGTVQTTAAPTVGTNTLSVVNNMGGGNNSGAPLSLIGSGRNNIIQGTADYAIILGGKGNVIENQSLNFTSSTLAPANPGSHNFISSGELNTIKPNVNHAAIIGGRSNTIAAGAVNSIILGGNGITATQPNTVYAQNIAVTNALTSPSFMFDSINGFRFTSATNSTPSIYSLGKGIQGQPWLPGPCFTPNVNQAYMIVPQTQIFSTMQNGKVNSAFLMGADWSTGNGTLEVQGTDNHGGENNSLQINNQCGRNTYINTNSALSNGGGTVFMGNRVQMAQSAQIGWNWTTGSVYDTKTALNIFPDNSVGSGIKLNSWNTTAKPIPFISINCPNAISTSTLVVLNSNGEINATKLNVAGNGYFSDAIAINTASLAKPFPTGYQLAVNGKVIAVEYFAKLTSAWPDYVFKKDYKLEDLNKLKNYINTKEHLPGIPSAADVDEKGVSLGDMVAKQMQKIEELTLYLIQLNEKVNALQAENEKLKRNN